MILLVGDDDVDVIARTQAMVRHAQQAVRIGRQIDADDVRAFIGDHVQKSGILMGEAVVILPPDQRCDEDVDRGHRRAPVQLLLRFLQPFGVLIEHRIDDVDEGFVGGKEAVTAGEDVSFEPAFERMLAQHLHHAAGDVEFAAVGIFRLVFGKPGLFRSGVDGGESVGGGFIRDRRHGTNSCCGA